jgi:hypothetical protein
VECVDSVLPCRLPSTKAKRLGLTEEEFKDKRKEASNSAARERRRLRKELFNLTSRNTLAMTDGLNASNFGIPFERQLSKTSPDYRLAFLPVVSKCKMTAAHLCALQDIECRLLVALGAAVAPAGSAHRYAGNQGKSLGLTAVSGGPHARKGMSGSIHINRHLKSHAVLQKDVNDLVVDIILESYGQKTWFVELVRRLQNIPDQAFLPTSTRRIPVSHIWWTHSPKVCHVHCDKNSLGVTFVFAASTVAGGELVVDKPVGNGFQLRPYHLSAGTIIGGSWGQYAHCNLPVRDTITPRRSWVVYLDYRAISRKYKNLTAHR